MEPQALHDGNLVTINDRRIKIVRGDDIEIREIPYIEIVSPGQKHSTVHRKVTEEDKIKYKEVWDAYLNKEELRAAGLPLRKWAGIDDLMVPEYEHLNVFTVEALASVPDGHLVNLGPGARQLQKDAIKFLEKGDEKDIQLTEANARIDDLEKKLNAFMDASGANPDPDGDSDEPVDDSSGHAEGDGGL